MLMLPCCLYKELIGIWYMIHESVTLVVVVLDGTTQPGWLIRSQL